MYNTTILSNTLQQCFSLPVTLSQCQISHYYFDKIPKINLFGMSQDFNSQFSFTCDSNLLTNISSIYTDAVSFLLSKTCAIPQYNITSLKHCCMSIKNLLPFVDMSVVLNQDTIGCRYDIYSQTATDFTPYLKNGAIIMAALVSLVSAAILLRHVATQRRAN